VYILLILVLLTVSVHRLRLTFPANPDNYITDIYVLMA